MPALGGALLYPAYNPGNTGGGGYPRGIFFIKDDDLVVSYRNEIKVLNKYKFIW